MFELSDLPTLHRMQAARDRINAMRHARAIEAYNEATGYHGDSLNMCIIHNSLVSLENGKPWPGINYSAMRRARWLTEDYRASRLVDTWYRRKCGLPY